MPVRSRRRPRPAGCRPSAAIASTAPLRIVIPVGGLDAAGAGLRAERDLLGDGRAERREAGVVADTGRPAELGETLAGQLHDRAALRRLVADRGHQRGLDDLGLGDARRRR